MLHALRPPAAEGSNRLVGVASPAPISLPVTVRQEHGRTVMELPTILAEALVHLTAFLAALAPCG